MRGLSDLAGGDRRRRADAATPRTTTTRSPPCSAAGLARCTPCWRRPATIRHFAPETAGADSPTPGPRRRSSSLTAAFAALDARPGLAGGRRAGSRPRDGAARPADATSCGISPTMAPAAAVTRIHGDFHLGQVLVAQGDVFIIDFEGEPAKPVDARRAKNQPAARCRRHAALVRLCRRRAWTGKSRASHAHLPAAAARRVPRRVSCTRATESFLAGYRDAHARSRDAAARPGDLLDLFLIEKAAYEIVYEAANRPAWIDVPLHGLAASHTRSAAERRQHRERRRHRRPGTVA